ncbi:hypothetical protein PR048_024243 [Dryococelus australis]|uniref:DDE Tnp4 domain-containing protein n=1 Tax=Dryococelus australis TaxID=614101 RepID=A0ABQ9GN24_9NEOP|nr:hypothetical protein PR048_024243 [Dryococelus australis]
MQSWSRFYEKLINVDLQIPGRTNISHSNRLLEYGMEAVAMRSDLIKPYIRESLTDARRIFNYRLSRARRVIENTFGILASRFCIFHAPINLKVDNIETVVLACCALHNFLPKISPQTYTPPGCTDNENISSGYVELGERCDPAIMHNLQRGTKGQLSACAKRLRDNFSQYFNQEGSLLRQADVANILEPSINYSNYA